MGTANATSNVDVWYQYRSHPLGTSPAWGFASVPPQHGASLQFAEMRIVLIQICGWQKKAKLHLSKAGANDWAHYASDAFGKL